MGLQYLTPSRGGGGLGASYVSCDNVIQLEHNLPYYKPLQVQGICAARHRLCVSLLDDVQDIRAKVLVMDTIFGFVAKANIGVSKAINKGAGVDAGLQVEM